MQYSSGLDVARVKTYAKAVAARPCHRGDIVVPFPRYLKVGNTARAFVTELVPLCGTALDTLESADEVAMTGWLLHAFDSRGCVFDDLLHNAVPFSVATAVADVSCDPRLSHPRRILDRRSRISNASLLGQLAVFSELLLQAEWLRSPVAADKAKDPEFRDKLILWLDEHSELLLSFHVLRELPTVATLLTAVRDAFLYHRRRGICQRS